MMTLEYLTNALIKDNFSLKGNSLVSNDQRIKVVLYKEGGFGSYYDGVWWEEAEYEDDGSVADLTGDLLIDFGFSPY